MQPAASPTDVRDVVAEALGLDPATISPDDDLVALGLHSIKMIKLANRWRRRGVDLTFSDLALEPTVRGWQALLDERAAAGRDDEDDRRPAAEVTHGDEDEPFGLAVMQHGYWIGRTDEQELGGVAAHLYAEFDRPAAGGGAPSLDPQRLGLAVRALVERHPMLRAAFSDDGTQRILPAPAGPTEVLTVTDLTGLDEAAVTRRLAELRETRTHQRLDAHAGKLVDVALTLLPGGLTRLHVDVDMLAADALSYRVLLADLAALYRDDLPDPAPLGYTYRRYLAEHAAANRDAHARERAWWQPRIPAMPDAPELPLVPESQRVDPRRSVRYDHHLDATQKTRLAERAHRHGVTPAMILASVFAEIVGAWSGRQRFLLNLPLFNREPLHPDVESLVGDFSSSVLLDVDLTRHATALERARAMQRSLHTSAAHSAYPGLDVLRDLGRTRGEPVLASVVYTSGLDLGELFADRVLETFGDPSWIISQGPQVVLDAQVVELRGGLLLNWDVREHAFRPGVMDAMAGLHHRTIAALLADDEAAWHRPIVAGPPPEQLVARRRAERPALPRRHRSLHGAVLAAAAATPEAPAVLWGENGVLTHGDLAERARRVAGALRARGVTPGDTVSIRLAPGPDQVAAVVGTLLAGATYVPIGTGQPGARRAAIERIAGVTVALVEPGAESTTAITVADALAADAVTADPVEDPDALAYVLFTSGSTGEPKGVEVTHAAALATIEALNDEFAVGPGDRTLGLSALEFDLSVYDLFGPLAVGGSVLAVAEDVRRDGIRALALLRSRGATLLNCAPGLAVMLADAVGAEPRLGDVRAVLLGGDRVPSELAERLQAASPGLRFAGLGGTTETAIHSTLCEVDAARPTDGPEVGYGVPLPGVRCRVVDELGRDCPDWVAGELWIGGVGVARGYRGDPERTDRVFVERPEDPGVRWYRTGDLARYRPDGTLDFLGRRDHQVKIRGHRVELGEVEAALTGVPGVRTAVAALAETASSARLGAVVVTDTALDGDPDGAVAERVRGAVAGVLPAVMVPDDLLVVAELPLTANGKTDRRAVRDQLLRARADAGADPASAPATDLEAALATIVAEVLGRERVGAEDDFFALGGDSVLATTAVARVREWLDTAEATVADLFAARSVRGLAERLVRKQSTPGRLEQVATVYLEIAALSDDEAERAARAEVPAP